VVYENYIKAIETPEHHTEAFTVIEDAYANLLAEPRPTTPAQEPPRIAFLIPHGGMLAHTEVLASFLAGLRRLDAPPIEPIVLMYGAGSGGDLGAKLDTLGVPWEALGGAAGGAEARYRKLRDRCAALRVEGAVIVSLPLHMAYFCRRPVAPVQMWWSMKFALPNFDVDGRVFYRSPLDQKVEVAGRTWRGGPLAFTAPPSPDPQAVTAIRDRYPGMKILGTVAREEKIANAEYLDAVVAVLRRHADACFLWTGRNPLREVQNAFDKAGVADRCHFVGWVDPAPYIAAFDLFLETYPLTGLMCGWAMAFGKPVVSVGELGFLATYLKPLFEGEIAADPEAVAGLRRIFDPVAGRLPGLWADRPADIPTFVDALLADPALAARLGAVQQRYVQTVMADEAASAATQARHFAEIVREARTAQ
jgi:glycosyltransferase involved in cell wall biosynthesis